MRLEVYSNFQCSVCRQFYLEVVSRLQRDFPAGEVCVAFHDVPLRGYDHGNTAARLAIAAGEFGAETRARVIDTLYRHQARWSADGDLEAVLAEVLSPAELDVVLAGAESSRVEEHLAEDRRRSAAREVRGTPTIYLVEPEGDAQQIPSTVQYPILRRYLRHLLDDGGEGA